MLAVVEFIIRDKTQAGMFAEASATIIYQADVRFDPDG